MKLREKKNLGEEKRGPVPHIEKKKEKKNTW